MKLTKIITAFFLSFALLDASVCCYVKALEDSSKQEVSYSCCSALAMDGNEEPEFPRHCSGCDLADGKLELSKVDPLPTIQLFEVSLYELPILELAFKELSLLENRTKTLSQSPPGISVPLKTCKLLI